MVSQAATKLFGWLFVVMLLMITPGNAAVLSITGGVNSTIPGNFNPTGFPLENIIGTPIKVFDSGATGGLSLSDSTKITFEFLGSEADFINFSANTVGAFSSETSVVGKKFVSQEQAGFLPFDFTTEGGAGGHAENGGTITDNLSIAYAALFDGSFLILFDDGGAGPDFDRDDMAVRVSVSQVPLPAAVWLLISAVLGLLSVSKIRPSSAPTA
jgi:hypothetical protein